MTTVFRDLARRLEAARKRVRKHGPSTGTVLRYLMFQIPGLAAVIVAMFVGSRWLELPRWVWIALPAAWVVKDLFLFPLLWRAYSNEPSRLIGEGALMGARGFALARLAPYGYVRIGSERWRAELESGEAPVEEGASIYVCGIQGLTLRVRGEEKRDEPAPVESPRRDSSMGTRTERGMIRVFGG